jgi:hypothetical protein
MDYQWDLQVVRGAHMIDMICGRELMEGDSVVIGRREKFRRVMNGIVFWGMDPLT